MHVSYRIIFNSPLVHLFDMQLARIKSAPNAEYLLELVLDVLEEATGLPRAKLDTKIACFFLKAWDPPQSDNVFVSLCEITAFEFLNFKFSRGLRPRTPIPEFLECWKSDKLL